MVRNKDMNSITVANVEEHAQVFQAICAGADGYLLKKSSPIDILRAIEDVVMGSFPMTPSIAQKVMKMFRNFVPKPECCAGLTPRENDVLKALVDGLDYKQKALNFYH